MRRGRFSSGAAAAGVQEHDALTTRAAAFSKRQKAFRITEDWRLANSAAVLYEQSRIFEVLNVALSQPRRALNRTRRGKYTGRSRADPSSLDSGPRRHKPYVWGGG